MDSASLFSGDAAHAAAVAAIAAAVRARPPTLPLSVSKATRSHTPHVKHYKRVGHPVDVSALTRVLRVDAAARVAVAEGQVSIWELCAACLAHGLMPPVVPELSDFTLAGLVNGLGIQSGSHKYGLFPDSLLSFECVLGDGRVVAPARGGGEAGHEQLFHDLPGSYGSLGIVTAVAVRLIAAQPLVRSRYRLFATPTAFDAALRAAVDQGHSAAAPAPAPGKTASNTFVEGFVYAADKYVLVESRYASEAEAAAAGLSVFEVAKHGEEWYHQHCLSLATAGGAGGAEDALRSLEYSFRMERGMWWMVECVAGLPLLSNSRAGRALLDRSQLDEAAALPPGGWFGQSAANPRWSAEDLLRCLVHQDMGVRLSRVPEVLEYQRARLGVYPIWVCPYRVFSPRGALWSAGWARAAEEEVAAGRARADALGAAAARDADDPLSWHFPPGAVPPRSGFPFMACDIGIYGEPTVRGFRGRRDVHALQILVDAPSFWGMSFLTREEIATKYDFISYAAMRMRYGASADANSAPALLDIRDKTSYCDLNAPDPGPIPMWRVVRAGLVPHFVSLGVAAVAVGVAFALWQRRTVK